MQSDVPPHEKIRFRRSDLKSLDSMPSARMPAQSTLPWHPFARISSFIVVAIAGLFATAIGLFSIVYIAILAGVGQQRLGDEAEKAVAALFGENYEVEIASIGLAIDTAAQLSLEVRNASVESAAPGTQVMQIDRLRFGLRILPLISGNLSIGSADLDGARIVLDSIPGNGTGLPTTFLDSHGRIDPDAVLDTLFDGASQAVGALARLGVREVSLARVEVLTTENAATMLTLERAVVAEAMNGSLRIEADLGYAGTTASVTSTFASIAFGATATDTLSLSLNIPPAADDKPHQIGRHSFTSANLDFDGHRLDSEEVLSIVGTFDDADIDLADGQGLLSDIEIVGRIRRGEHKVELERLQIDSGRSAWRFHGAIGPVPVSPADGTAAGYRFELVSDGSTVAPAGSTEAALTVAARFAGTVSRDGKSINVGQIGVRSLQGEVTGSAAIRLETGRAPGLAMELDVASMPVGEVKQLWPWFAAPGARNWVVSNIFGGRVEAGRLELRVAAGRMGNGVPFGPDEVSGRFTVQGTRFDVAGRIPPVRDGFGSVDFRGTDVDVALHSGTVYMPDGRTVDASNGELIIRAAHLSPIVGKLTLDIDGKADAVMALANYEPIDVDQYIDLTPDELQGSVQGIIHADIPLQKDIPAETLDWKVDLAYEDLSLSRPFEGQIVTEADGSIIVDPTRAAIDASARLNGAPATIHMVEPLGSSDVEKERRIALQLDDKAREALAPGLETLLTGMTEVELNDADSGERTFKVDLDRASLTIPWAGWSKGPGVPGGVRFAMRTDDNRIELADFELTGETFTAQGDITLVDGDVTRVRFPHARLNRSDDFSFNLAAEGSGYAIDIRGKSIDARSIIKLYSQDSVDSGDGASTSVPVNVELEVDTMTGFHGEALRNVKLTYSGTGARTDHLEFTAVTKNGTQVTFKDGRDGEARSVTMQSADAGAVLRFLDIYEHMEGGTLTMALAGSGNGPLRGQVDAREFWVVNEPRLESLVSTPPQAEGRSLNQAVRGDIDTSRVQFQHGSSQIEKGTAYLKLSQGVLRGPLIGSTFQGTFYDPQGNMEMTGTFMPAYGLNRIFGEIPLFGAILGNGRDRGLIGITFKLAGKSSEPQLQINPLSVIAPGIFRSVFEYR